MKTINILWLRKRPVFPGSPCTYAAHHNITFFMEKLEFLAPEYITPLNDLPMCCVRFLAQTAWTLLGDSEECNKTEPKQTSSSLDPLLLPNTWVFGQPG